MDDIWTIQTKTLKKLGLFAGDIQKVPLLYVRGNKDTLMHKNKIAIIGTRTPTEKAIKAARKMGEYAAKENAVTLNGLAYGCDTIALWGSLNVGGKCIAVLAHGLSFLYPKGNEDLAKTILDNDGVLISQYPNSVAPARFQFVERDYTQAALSNLVIVVETGVKGGTMHTVRAAEKLSVPIMYMELDHDQKTQTDLFDATVNMSVNGIPGIKKPSEIKKLLIQSERKTLTLNQTEFKITPED